MAKSKYNDNFPLLAEGYAREGLNDEQIASKLGIVTGTFYVYQAKYKDFSESLKRGKTPINFRVENALLKKAEGYFYDEITKEEIQDANGNTIGDIKIKTITKHVPASDTAIAIWLNNREPGKWRQKQKEEVEAQRKVVVVRDGVVTIE